MARKVTGLVVSTGMDKTAGIRVSHSRTHPLYRKNYTVSKKYLAHDEDNRCVVGDKVEITETIPRSKRKCWEVTEILEKAKKV